MNKPKELILVTILFLFFSIQLYLTIFGGFFWPFSSYRLFSQLPKKEKFIVKAVLEDGEGNLYTVPPGRVIPIEYCRCSGLIRNLHKNMTDEQKREFVDYLLKRLNEHPWWAFDEMYRSVKPLSDTRFTSLRFETHTVEFVDHMKIKDRSILF